VICGFCLFESAGFGSDFCASCRVSYPQLSSWAIGNPPPSSNLAGFRQELYKCGLSEHYLEVLVQLSEEAVFFETRRKLPIIRALANLDKTYVSRLIIFLISAVSNGARSRTGLVRYFNLRLDDVPVDAVKPESFLHFEQLANHVIRNYPEKPPSQVIDLEWLLSEVWDRQSIDFALPIFKTLIETNSRLETLEKLFDDGGDGPFRPRLKSCSNCGLQSLPLMGYCKFCSDCFAAMDFDDNIAQIDRILRESEVNLHPSFETLDHLDGAPGYLSKELLKFFCREYGEKVFPQVKAIPKLYLGALHTLLSEDGTAFLRLVSTFIEIWETDLDADMKRSTHNSHEVVALVYSRLSGEIVGFNDFTARVEYLQTWQDSASAFERFDLPEHFDFYRYERLGDLADYLDDFDYYYSNLVLSYSVPVEGLPESEVQYVAKYCREIFETGRSRLLSQTIRRFHEILDKNGISLYQFLVLFRKYNRIIFVESGEVARGAKPFEILAMILISDIPEVHIRKFISPAEWVTDELELRKLRYQSLPDFDNYVGSPIDPSPPTGQISYGYVARSWRNRWRRDHR